MGNLGEDEAVYFLMQMMNGFRVLHKNKIMHRDVKLANLFLQNDKIVIGDFGFAKQGVDVTRTRLGTPITMAPELLVTKEGSYTNKADLWSIGVCFYQMLFGKTPFDAKNYGDLKIKVKSLSGDKLRFPPDYPVSSQCKNLLISLLQYDPKKRIEWVDFFNHKLFEIHAQNNNKFNQSLLIRDNEENVKQEFQKNKQTDIQNDQLQNPEQMQVGKLNREKAEEEVVQNDQINNINEEENFEELFRFIRARYCHEKKKIIFIMYTVRKLRNLAKLKYIFNQLTEKLMLSACLLLHKGLLLNDQSIKSLKSNVNVFNLNGFNEFFNQSDNKKIRANFEDDNKIYKTFQQQMNQKFMNEVSNPQYKEIFTSIQSVNLGNIKQLEKHMMDQFKFLLGYMPNLQLTPDIEGQTNLAILHFYYSIQSEDVFPFIVNQQIFEWKNFEKENDQKNAKEKLKKLI